MDPITQVVLASCAGAGGAGDAIVKSFGRVYSAYYRYPESENIFVRESGDHVFLAYTIQETYNGSYGYQEHALHIFKMAKVDLNVVWHKIRYVYTTSAAFGIFKLYGFDISPDGNWMLCQLYGSATSSANSSASNHRPHWVEFSTADGSLRTTAQGAVYAGGLQDTGSNQKEKHGGSLYFPGSNSHFITAGGRDQGGGFYKVQNNGSSYSTPWWVNVYNVSPFNNIGSQSNSSGSAEIFYNPDNPNELCYSHHFAASSSDKKPMLAFYDMSSGTPSMTKALYVNRSCQAHKFCVVGNDVYCHAGDWNSYYSYLLKYTWNGSSFVFQWGKENFTNNGGYGARRCGALTWDPYNNKLFVFEDDPGFGKLIREIDPSNGNTLAKRRFVQSDGSAISTTLNATNDTGAARQGSYSRFMNQCHRASSDGFMYIASNGQDTYYPNTIGLVLYKIPTDLSKLPSTNTIYSSTATTLNGSITRFTLAVADADPFGVYSNDNPGSTTLTQTGYQNDTSKISNISYSAGTANNYLDVTTDSTLQRHPPLDMQVSVI